MRLLLLVALAISAWFCFSCPSSDIVQGSTWRISADLSTNTVYFENNASTDGFYSVTRPNVDFNRLVAVIDFEGVANVTVAPKPELLGFFGGTAWDSDSYSSSLQSWTAVTAFGYPARINNVLSFNVSFTPTSYVQNYYGKSVCAGFSDESGNNMIKICPYRSYIVPDAVCTPYFCRPCDCLCQICFGPGSGTCLKCNPGYFLQPHSTTCRIGCPTGYYQNTTHGTCLPCKEGCLNCTSNTLCSNCHPGYYLDSTSEGTSSGYTCSQCAPECSLCTGPTKDDCSQCSSGYYMISNTSTCSSNCPDGYYADSSSLECQTCHPACLTCVGSDQSSCSLCAAGFYLQPDLKTCLTSCPSQGYWADSSGNNCLQCSTECASCFGSTNADCLTCSPGNYLQPGTTVCFPSCPNSYYADTSTQTCVSCHSNCAQCFGPAITQCTSCVSGYFVNASATTCQTTCSDGFWTNSLGNICSLCPHECLTCQGSTTPNCTSCKEGYFFITNTSECLPSCPAGYYASTEEGICQPCDEACATCNGSSHDDCSSCNSGYFLQPYSPSCLRTCPEHKYWPDTETNTCVACAPECLSCSGSNCTSCNYGYYLQPSTHICMATCPSGYVQDMTNGVCLLYNGTAVLTSSSNNAGTWVAIGIIGALLGIFILIMLVIFVKQSRKLKILYDKITETPGELGDEEKQNYGITNGITYPGENVEAETAREIEIETVKGGFTDAVESVNGLQS